MDRTVTALFDSREEAEAAKSRLQSSNIDADRIRIVDKSSSSGTSGGSSGTGGESRGFFGSLSDMFMPHEDRYAYNEGINRGGYLLCAEVDDREADEAVRILEQSNSVDFDERQEQWRGEGWAGWTGGTMGNQGVSSSGTPMTAGNTQPSFSAQGGQQAFSGQERQQGFSGQPGQQQQFAGATGQVVGEEHIPIVEEELKIGKREVNRGGARVRSYVREIPVHEQVNLREEHVEVERRPVNQRIDPREAGNLLQERTIEMTETAEEAVVAKEAHVAEEVVVRKTAEQHVEQIDDTVRKTEVDVDDNARTGAGSAFGFQDRDRDATPDRIDSDLDRTNDPAFRR